MKAKLADKKMNLKCAKTVSEITAKNANRFVLLHKAQSFKVGFVVARPYIWVIFNQWRLPSFSIFGGDLLFIWDFRSVYKELHADRETGCWQQNRLNIKHRESARYSACFVVWGFQRGLPLGTRLCLQSVVCYTLCRRCCENEVAAGSGKGIWSSRKTGLWLRVVEPQAQGWFRQQTGCIWKPPFLVPRRTSGQNVPNLWTHSQKSKQIFLSKLEWAGKPF